MANQNHSTVEKRKNVIHLTFNWNIIECIHRWNGRSSHIDLFRLLNIHVFAGSKHTHTHVKWDYALWSLERLHIRACSVQSNTFFSPEFCCSSVIKNNPPPPWHIFPWIWVFMIFIACGEMPTHTHTTNNDTWTSNNNNARFKTIQSE